MEDADGNVKDLFTFGDTTDASNLDCQSITLSKDDYITTLTVGADIIGVSKVTFSSNAGKSLTLGSESALQLNSHDYEFPADVVLFTGLYGYSSDNGLNKLGAIIYRPQCGADAVAEAEAQALIEGEGEVDDQPVTEEP